MNGGYSFKNSPGMARALQRLAREEMKLRLLRDIRVDIAVCRLEGWDCREYILELKNLIDQFL